MKKSDKINILNDLIKRTAELACRDSASANAIIREALSFVRNALEKANAVSEWEKQIKGIHWIPMIITDGTSDSNFEKVWLSGKNELHGTLVSVKQEVELYSQDKDEHVRKDSSEKNNSPIIFISHSSSDKPYGDALQKFIMGLGIEKEQLIYTSHELHKIPQGADIYEYLREKIYKGVFTIFLFSDQYLNSAICLNEMGAAWVVRSEYANIYTPAFDFGSKKYHECVIGSQRMGVILNGDGHCRTGMNELKDKIVSMFGLKVDETTTSRLVDGFVEEIVRQKEKVEKLNSKTEKVKKRKDKDDLIILGVNEVAVIQS